MNFIALLRKYKITTIATSAWLIVGLWYVFSKTSEAIDGVVRNSGGDLIYQASDPWTSSEGLIIFLEIFAVPVMAIWIVTYFIEYDKKLKS